MNEEEKITISVNEEDVQNLINCYEKDIKYIKQLEQERDKYKSIVEEIKTELTKGITFCENDSQGHYDICNIAINREKKILEKIKELEEGNSNE